MPISLDELIRIRGKHGCHEDKYLVMQIRLFVFTFRVIKCIEYHLTGLKYALTASIFLVEKKRLKYAVRQETFMVHLFCVPLTAVLRYTKHKSLLLF